MEIKTVNSERSQLALHSSKKEDIEVLKSGKTGTGDQEYSVIRNKNDGSTKLVISEGDRKGAHSTTIANIDANTLTASKFNADVWTADGTDPATKKQEQVALNEATRKELSDFLATLDADKPLKVETTPPPTDKPTTPKKDTVQQNQGSNAPETTQQLKAGNIPLVALSTKTEPLWFTKEEKPGTGTPFDPDVRRFIQNPNAQTVVIDAGHGGADSGATADKDRIREDDLALAQARRVTQELLKKGYNVIITRNSDTEVALGSRKDNAATEKADLYVSLHFNASPDGKVGKYVESYYFDQNDKEAAETVMPFLEATSKKFGLTSNGARPDTETGKGHLDQLRTFHPQFPGFLIESGFVKDPTVSKDSKLIDAQSVSIAEGIDAYLKKKK